MAALAASLLEDLGGVDVIFANAGVAIGGKLEEVSVTDADWMISVNFLGIVNAARAFVPHLRAAAEQGRDARFVITGSEHSLGIPSIGAANVYTGTKHGALGLADVMRSDLAGSGVKVSVLCPGIVATNIFDARANRSDRFGGAAPMAPAAFDQAKGFMDRAGQAPELTAQLCFEGLDRGDFLIITDPQIGAFARKRMAEIEAAIVLIEHRLSSGKP
jgi:NAD(P)-dependent dehydrogenase (short-subunit alcohol dehydrogenase family)